MAEGYEPQPHRDFITRDFAYDVTSDGYGEIHTKISNDVLISGYTPVGTFVITISSSVMGLGVYPEMLSNGELWLHSHGWTNSQQIGTVRILYMKD